MTTSTIDLSNLIIDKIKDLPLEKQQEILDFAEFISNKYHQEQKETTKPKKKRIAGLYKGKGWISDDFNEPLSDDFWNFNS